MEQGAVNHWARRQVDRVRHRALAWLYPPRCRLCRAPAPADWALCAPCASELPWLPSACPVCAEPRGGATAGPCARCLTRPPPFHAARVALRYTAPVDRLILEFKHGGRLATGRLLAALLVHHLEETGAPAPDRVVPVPLHPQRLRQRGFNQAAELAALLPYPAGPRIARRVRATPSQEGLTRAERRRNLRGAFTIDGSLDGQHVAVLDDVLTTGQTAAALATALRAAGAARVEVWALARAVMRGRG